MTGSAPTERVTGNSQAESCYRWDEPDSNLTVLLRTDVVERLQISALAARGCSSPLGNEVGGILLGKSESCEGRTVVTVDGFEPVKREHPEGTLYVLSREDAALFESAIASFKSRLARCVVGYYRGHNRNGLFLSPDDLKLIQRHFRDPESVFLLIKPLPNRTCTAGFFFWKDGLIQADFTDSEVPLIPLTAPPTEEALTEKFGVPPAVESRPAVVPFAHAGAWALGQRRLGGFVLAGLALAATTGVLMKRTPRHDSTVLIAPALPKPVQQSASISPGPAKPEPSLKLPAAVIASARKREIEKRPATSKPFVLPPSHSQSAPAEISLSTAPPVVPPAPTVPAAPFLPEPVMEHPVAPPNEAHITNPVISPLPATVPRASSPRVVHSVTPALPRGVGSKITADVQVDVEVAIDEKGKVTAARIVSTRGAAANLLTLEALKAAQLFRFYPAEENGHAIAGATVLNFRFAQNAK